MKHSEMMCALVEGKGPKEVGGGFGGRDTTFALPEEGWGIVGKAPERAFADVETLGRAIMVKEGRGEF